MSHGYKRYADDEPKKFRQTTAAEFISVLKPYLWPVGSRPRARALLCFSALIFSKFANIYAPYWMGKATESLVSVPVELPVAAIVAYSVFRFGTSAGGELQRFVYLRVKEVAYRYALL